MSSRIFNCGEFIGFPPNHFSIVRKFEVVVMMLRRQQRGMRDTIEVRIIHRRDDTSGGAEVRQWIEISKESSLDLLNRISTISASRK
jgi:hypothetical protein